MFEDSWRFILTTLRASHCSLKSEQTFEVLTSWKKCVTTSCAHNTVVTLGRQSACVQHPSSFLAISIAPMLDFSAEQPSPLHTPTSTASDGAHKPPLEINNTTIASRSMLSLKKCYQAV